MTEKRHITYLLGAGASYHSLPLVKGIPEGLKSFLRIIDNCAPVDPIRGKLPFADNRIENLKAEFVTDVNWLHDKTINHSSIDTYAKKLLTIGNYQELEKLKIIFTLYFLFTQFTNLADLRYDAFIAALIDHKTKKMPDHVKILSWNYDIQFEKAMSEFLTDKSFTSAQFALNTQPRNESFFPPKSEFSLFKINGSAVLKKSNSEYFTLTDTLTVISEIDALTKILEYYEEYKVGKISSAIKFAWEEDTLSKYIIETSIEKIAQTTILVVIGYSFPFFNRQIDRALLKIPNLQKIYFQAPDYGINSLMQSFKSIRKFPKESIDPITETDQFFLPPEL